MRNAANAPSLHLHSALAFHGGAARVARMIGAWAARSGEKVRFSCEIADDPALAGDAQADMKAEAVSPEGGVSLEVRAPEMIGSGPKAALLHLHAARDWPLLLSSLEKASAAGALENVPLVITLHDFSLLGGGCIYPLGCENWHAGCEGACPQERQEAGARAGSVRALVRRLSPVLVSPSGWLARMGRKVFPDNDLLVIPNGVEDPLEEALSLTGSRDTAGDGAPGGPWSALSRLKQGMRHALGIAPGAKVILFAGHGGERATNKGGPQWRPIWRQIRDAVPDLMGIMAGGNRLERQDGLLHWPYADRLSMNRAMLAADLFLQVSPAENHPLVVLEAFAAGTPVCAYSVGGVPEQIVPGRCGSLHAPEDQRGLVQAAISVLRRPALLRGWAREARERFERHFTVEKMGEAYRGVYDRLRHAG